MLPKGKRVNKALFKGAFGGGRPVFSSILTLRSSGPKAGPSRFSFVVPKSVAKSAVSRNILRRRGYSAIKILEKDVIPGFVCVFFFKKGSEKTEFEEIKKEVAGLLAKARLLKQ